MMMAISIKRYQKIADDQCSKCEAYKPRTSNQCKIYKRLFVEMEPDMIANEKCFLKEGRICKGFKG